MTLLLTALAAIGSATAVPHEIRVDHRGSAYQVSYRPQIDTRRRTIGTAAGTRMGNQRCRWSVTVAVERQVHSASGPAATKLLPAAGLIEGSRPGSCAEARRAIDAEIAAKAALVRAHVERVAQADRPTLLADIDAARSLALN